MKKFTTTILSGAFILMSQQALAATTYTVNSGDTLWSISNKTNISVSRLQQLNNLNSNAIYVGQKLLISNTATITSTVDAYDAPGGKKIASFAPQSISILSMQDQWYQISTSIGPLWISAAQTDRLNLANLSGAYDSPNGKEITSFAPQTVNVLSVQGQWFQISTSLGPLWINPSQVSSLALTNSVDAYDVPNGKKIASFAPQTVKVLNQQGQWYKISTGLGPLWVNPNPTAAPAPAPAPAPAATNPYPGSPLQIGSSGSAVQELQTALGISADGQFGPATQAALKAYQSNHGLTPDGICGPATWSTIFGSASITTPTPTPATPNGKTVAIDPGHGGWDPGAVSPDGTYERTINYQMASKLKSVLETRGYKVVMTRPQSNSCLAGTTSTTLDLKCRVDAAANQQANIFVSIHNNASGSGGYSYIHGTEVYYNARNDWDGHENPYPQDSLRLADDIHSKLVPAFGSYDRGVMNNNYYVNRMASMPSVLLEVGYMDNYNELINLKNDGMQTHVATGIADGIDFYFGR